MNNEHSLGHESLAVNVSKSKSECSSDELTAGRAVSVAVVGCGYWGPNLMRNFHTLPQSILHSVCDKSVKKLASFKAIYPAAKPYTDFHELLEQPEVNAVAIATPPHLHFDMAKAALLARKHVLIEKPMASSSSESEVLVRIAREQNLTLMVGHTYLYSNAVRCIKALIDNGEIGELEHISTRRANFGHFHSDINVAWDLAPHDLSILLYLASSRPEMVGCQGVANKTPGVEDETVMSLRFGSGLTATVQNSWLNPDKVREMVISGSRKTIVYNDMEPLNKVRVHDLRVESELVDGSKLRHHVGGAASPVLQALEPLTAECKHFLDCITDGTASLTDGLHATDVIRILEASSVSLQERGAQVRVKY